MKARILRILSLLSLALAPGRADDWLMYLGDLAHSSYRPNETQIDSANVAQLQPIWRTAMGAGVASGVTVSGGVLYFGDWAGNFHALNATTGASLWSQFLGMAPAPADPTCQPRGIGISGQPTVSGNMVYAVGGDSAVYALDASSGAVQWRTPLADPSVGSYLWSSVMLSQNALYVGIASLTDCPLVQGGLARIPLGDPSHPQVAYFTPSGTLGAGLWSTPAIDEQNNLVYVTLGNGAGQDPQQGIWGSALLALDATTLQVQSYFFLPISATDNDPDWGSSPILFESAGQPLVAANGKTGVMYVLHRPDLTPVWSYTLARDCDSPLVGCGSISTPAFDGSLLVTGAGEPDGNAPPGMVYAFDPTSQNLVWQYAAGAPVLAPITLTPGLVFVATESNLVVLDSATGNPLWTDGGASGGLYGQPVVANGVLYTAYVNGDVVAWGPYGTTTGFLPLTVSPATLQFNSTAGGPLPDAQAVTVSSPSATVNFTISSDSAWLTADLASGASPATINVSADPSALNPGVYNGNLGITPASGSGLTVSVSLVVNPAPAPITSSGIVSAASFQPGLAPGSLFAIFGGNLSAAASAPGGAWTTSWNGIAAEIDGAAVPLEYVGQNQINGQVPFEVTPGMAQFAVASNGVTTPPAAVTIQATAPSIFLQSNGFAAAINADGTVNGPDNPAAAGSFVCIYMTGQGAVTPAVSTGAPAPDSPLSLTVATTTATIGGAPAEVLFSGLAPSLIGVGQVNLTVPDVRAGDQQVVLTIGGVSSVPAPISVGGSPSPGVRPAHGRKRLTPTLP